MLRAMDWNTRRKILYGVATSSIVLALSMYLLRDTIFPVPTCSDKKQNGYEIGVDCGGSCQLRCQSEVVPLSTLWARALKTPEGAYDLVAMVSNKNVDNASLKSTYMFTAYDSSGVIIATTTGRITTPIDGDFPIIMQGVPLPKTPETLSLSLFDGPHYTVTENPTSPTLRISNIRYEAGAIPRVYALLQNTKRVEVRNLPVHVVLYDENNNAYAVGTTFVETLDKEQSREIVFTWNAPLASTPVKIRIYPLFNPFYNSK
jgi:hypothetical protein